MSRHRTWLVLAAAALLLPAAAATAAPGPVTLLPLPPFSNGPQVTLSWDPAPFTPNSIGRQYRATIQDLTVPELTSRVVAAPATGTTFALLDGHEYAIRVVAEERECIAPGVCDTAHLNGPSSETRITRVDSAPPVVAVQINGGAAFTNNPSVSLDVSAFDPGAAGRPASGVRALEISQPGAFSCSGRDCVLPFAPSVPITLAPGPDGPRTVSVSALDAATTTGPAPPSPDGNASPPVQATVLLDRLAPTPVVGLAAPTARPGVPLALGGRRSVDGAAGAADSGLDPSGFQWSFGDGSVGRGPLVAHAYARLGTYKGTLTLSDRAGNAAAAAFTVFVGDRTGIVVRGAGRLLSPERPAALVARRTTVLRWRAEPEGELLQRAALPRADRPAGRRAPAAHLDLPAPAHPDDPRPPAAPRHLPPGRLERAGAGPARLVSAQALDRDGAQGAPR